MTKLSKAFGLMQHMPPTYGVADIRIQQVEEISDHSSLCMAVKQLASHVSKMEGIEGVVLMMPDSRMVKLKSSWYLHLRETLMMKKSGQSTSLNDCSRLLRWCSLRYAILSTSLLIELSCSFLTGLVDTR